jgi:phage terminase large subunit-like protein
LASGRPEYHAPGKGLPHIDDEAVKTMVAQIASLSEEERARWLASLTEEEAELLLYTWEAWARPAQLEPAGAWTVWLILSGRGFGKTRAGAEWSRGRVEKHGGKRGAIIARTAADCRDTLIEGESGILACSPPWFMPKYEPSKRRLTWPNGAVATTFGADEPDLLRGPQFDWAWADELAAWRYPLAWDNLMFGLRLGINPKVVVTTTPRPTPIIKDLIKDSKDKRFGSTVVTGGSTYENLDNLAPTFIREVIKRYENTRLGEQELYARILEDVAGALWSRQVIEATRIQRVARTFKRVIVGVDPQAAKDDDEENTVRETGIVVGGKSTQDHMYVIEDATTNGSPHEWGSEVVRQYYKHEADLVVGEVNHGGDMVGYVIQTIDPSVPFLAVRASRGKYVRAEPVAALYEQGKAHHLGMFPTLEDQMCTWLPGQSQSPNHMDALVWMATEMMLETEYEAPSNVVPESLDQESTWGRPISRW